MTLVTPSDSRYIPFTQQAYCCVPTCISMIMYRRGIPLLPQETIGHALGLAVPQEDRHLFWSEPGTKKGPSGWGTRITEPQFEINTVFQQLQIPLKVTFHTIDQFADEVQFTDFLGTIERDDKDVLACFEWSGLYTNEYVGGHVTVVDRVNLAEQSIRLIDPEYFVGKWPIHPIAKLFPAMQTLGASNLAGLWEFSVI